MVTNMAREFYEKIDHWYIYAVVSRRDKLAYIAKSCAKNPIARFYEHIRGEIKWTKDDFGPDGYSTDPEFVILESLDCTSPIAYRHIVAWCHYFEEQRFCLLNSPTKGWQCDYLKPDTKKIYDAICAPVSITEVLEREVVYERMEREPAVIMPDKPKSKSQMTQLNIRVLRNVAEAFREFCEQSHLSQNNALALLLAPENQARLETVNAPWQELQYQKELNEQLKIENEQLRKKRNELQLREKGYRKVIAKISNEVVGTIAKNNGKDFVKKPVLKAMHFKDAKRQLDFESYQYPDKYGIEEITLVGIVNGVQKMRANRDLLLPTALFVLGETNGGDKIKFRWYPKEHFVGITPRNEMYAYSGARWLAGFVVAPDGATDLIANIPLELIEEEGNLDLQMELIEDSDLELQVELIEENDGSESPLSSGREWERDDPLEERLRDVQERAQWKASPKFKI